MGILEFRDEMVIPKINSELYLALYEIENWLKRICLTAYVLKHESHWMNSISTESKVKFKSRYNASHKLLYLDAQMDDNLIWMSTLGELSRLLFDDSVVPFVKELTGFSKERLKHKLDEIREIRNLLAHNQALSETTAKILQGVIASFKVAVDKFKHYFLYEFGDIFSGEDISDAVNVHFQAGMEENDWSSFQAFLARSKYFYSLTCLPVEPFGRFVSASKLLHEYEGEMGNILAFTLNTQGDEYSVLIPKSIEKERAIKVVDAFLRKPDVWTKKPYIRQHPKYVCNPKIWLYENRRDAED